MARIELPDASVMRRRPYKAASTSRELLALGRRTFVNWVVPAALRRATAFVSPEWLLDLKVTLSIRNGPRVRARVRDMGGPLDVFGLGAYDFKVDWSRAQYVIDAGANIGSFTLFAASRGARHIVAIEPDPKTYALLVENVRMAGLADFVTTLNYAIAGSAGAGLLYTPKMSTAATIVPGGGVEARTVSVETATLADVLKAMSWPRVDIMKMDIEGSEYEVFALMDLEILAGVGVIFIECHHADGADPSLIATRLRDAGFQVAADVASNNTMLVAAREGRLESA